ncbi:MULTISPECIES: ATP-binding cassette domain-containing protein [unclassified Streptomyces]|uniref:ATP-binding cassette domain-containing protein n=1 Tax=unclassified Streptomyces TaxID=2593676 RepID=UPI001317C41E|nr:MULTISPECIES: ATP-binding cassette domain-containing protein [unclassified Streptomyces]QHC31826.1 ATP-binding cassette domain-containing protein [Streptomyces sp. HF10]WKE69197.1 ATP-binding cassette domain-containing protein [Streptomyces sp. WP-1]
MKHTAPHFTDAPTVRYADAVRQRCRLMGAAWAAGPALCCRLWAVQLVRAVLPTLGGLATGWLVSLLISAPHERGELGVAVALCCLLLLAGQAADAFAPAVEFSVSQRVDAWQRDRIADLMGRPPGIAHLEDPEVQDRLAAATLKGLPGWASYTFGTAAVGQIVLVTRVAGACLATVVLAAGFSWAWALALLASTLVVRALTRREWLAQHGTVRRLAPPARRSNYWADVAVMPWAAKEVRIFGMADWTLGRFRETTSGRAGGLARVRLGLLRRSAATSLLLASGVAAVLAALAGAAASGRITPGSLAVHLGALWGVVAVHGMDVEAFDVAFAGLPTLAGHRELHARVARTSRPTLAGTAHTAPPRPVRGRPPHVRLEAVEFRYGPTGPRVLDRLDLEIVPGELLALVGANGAGKTTLTKLITGMYGTTGGRITVDGVPLTPDWAQDWRTQVAIVSQEPVHYDLSLRDNVLLGAPAHGVDHDLLEAVAARAGIEDLVGKAAAGWDTPLSQSHPGGMDLSGGQWQRVALARALYAVARGARLIILDEPTSHLDVRAESAAFDRVAATAGDASVLLISHRLSTVRRADRILLLDGGRITEAGRHDELVARGGTYAEMFAAQAARFGESATTEGRAS